MVHCRRVMSELGTFCQAIENVIRSLVVFVPFDLVHYVLSYGPFSIFWHFAKTSANFRNSATRLTLLYSACNCASIDAEFMRIRPSWVFLW